MSYSGVIGEFLERYGNDPRSFVQEVLGVEPDGWQGQVLDWIGSGERRISCVSGHGVGKSSCASWAMVWHLLCKYPQKTVVTAPTVGQLQDALATECKRWINELPGALQEQIEVLTETIRLRGAPAESFISFRVSRAETPEALAGIHSDHVLLVVDEASGVPEGVYETAAGSMSGERATTILLGNPVRSTGFFHSTQTRLANYWKTIQVSCLDSPRVSADYIEDMKNRYGEDTNPYRVRVLGEFPIEDDDTILPRGLVESAIERDLRGIDGPVVVGVDIARRGGDASTICVRQGRRVVGEAIAARKGMDLMQVAGWIRKELDGLRQSGFVIEEVLLDSVGMGAGVMDRLLEEGVEVRGVNVGESPSMGTEYWNLKAELWWRCREWFETREVAIPSDSGLVEELVSVRRLWPSNGKMQVEPKDITRKRLGANASPDKADALVLTFANHSGWGSIHARKPKPLVRSIPGIV